MHRTHTLSFFLILSASLTLIFSSFANADTNHNPELIINKNNGHVTTRVQAYLDLEKCSELGNTKAECRNQFVAHQKEKALKKSKENDAITIISWFEETSDEQQTVSKN